MKKLVTILFLVLLVAACTSKDVDPYKDYRGSTSSQLFNNGEHNLAKGEYKEAVKNFEALDAIYPFGPYARQGQLDIIYAYYQNNDIASAIVSADRYIRLYPRGPNTDYAYYMKGIVGFDEGMSWLQKSVGVNPAVRDVSTLQQSFGAFAELARHYPHSYYAPASLAHMAYVRNLIAEREILIAKFYMKHDAYVAAANRASYVVQHFEGSSQVVKALAIMVRAYHYLGLTRLANASYRLLKMNYPNSEEFRQLQRA